jgi:hypothetical protein
MGLSTYFFWPLAMSPSTKLRTLSVSKCKKRVPSQDGHPFRIEWLPETGDVRTKRRVIPVPFNPLLFQKKLIKTGIQIPNQNRTSLRTDWYGIAHKYKGMLESRAVKNQAEIARKEGISRAMVTKIMNLLKEPQ